MSALRENWRIALLVVLLLGSAVALFVPGGVPGTTPEEGAGNASKVSNLQYGIQLSGGTRIRAPIVGTTAEGIDVAPNQTAALAQNVSNELGVDPIDVEVRPGQRGENGTVEVFTRNVTDDELRAAIESEGYQASNIRPGVTQATREEMVESVTDKIRTSSLSGGSVQEVSAPGSPRSYISITAPDREPEELIDILEERGVVRMYAVYPADNGTYVREQVLSQNEFAGVASDNTQTYGPVARVTVERSTAERFSGDMVDAGFGQARNCGNYNHSDIQQTEGRCLVATLNGEPFYARGVAPGLAESFQQNTFKDDPVFVLPADDMDMAREIELNLKAGRLPAPLNFADSDQLSLSPALAEQFQQNSVVTGLLAVVAVSLVVYIRYGRPEVAFPMIVTALSEVFILLGFVALVQYPLNLSHLAGFIAVIGTGVDDLIIIADEILQQGKVETGRVFQSRFRKAFWVIGAAAATTIVAMSPLMVLSLGDLSGFAIITIVGVLIGVLVTRPAYGDILRNLVLDED
ncbi:preprotein translocase subunit SecD [Haloarcula pellucida]|uniref:Protein-export membrane protein SecD n=1 Tax=Haloarcula pellucida TaxID=1427151 RepID=A0A830GK31_9EURY|nr:preprotein translocase subunit SecD [Halomicroarcula pellucida]MBX0348778.1 preprotein translocase subunit SecD [Halomicroarcula pellucida]GGN91846.1 preprotein translocase subunit SecD [Halomicroarcula pellucida]